MNASHQNGSSHYLAMNGSNDIDAQQARKQSYSTKRKDEMKRRQPMPTITATTTTEKSLWQTAQDLTKDTLLRQTSKLHRKEDPKSSVISQESIVSTTSPSQEITNVYQSHSLHEGPRMPTDKDATDMAIAYELLCSSCRGPCVDDYLRCRVCTSAYHSKCLFERGYTNKQQIHLPRLAKQNWNCPECSDLTRLLDHDEQQILIQAFEEIDTSRDGYIDLEEFLSFSPKGTTFHGFELFVQYNRSLGERYFSLMDSSRKGFISWSDFALFYSCKLILAKDKLHLAKKLSEKELVWARHLFLKDPRRTFDSLRRILITREHLQRVHDDLLQSLEMKYGIDFISTVVGDDDNTNYNSEKNALVSWAEYLREVSHLILLSRTNNNAFRQTTCAVVDNHVKDGDTAVRSPQHNVREHSSRALLRSSLSTVPILPNISVDQLFCKYAKILDKINKRSNQEALAKKKMGSSMNFSIVENADKENRSCIPKLKPNRRDDRRIVTDPWTSVKELQQLRNKPIPIKKTRTNLT